VTEVALEMSESARRTAGRQQSRAGTGRGQANLVALGAALFALTSVLVVGVVAANGALAGETRDSGERHAATAVADRLVAADSPLTNRSNVLDASAVDDLTVTDLRTRYPVLDGRGIRVTLGDDVLVEDGSPEGGTSISRIVLVEETAEQTLVPRFRAGNHVTFPRRTSRVKLDIDPSDNVSVSAVRANERTVLSDDDGLDGDYEVAVSRRETLRLTFVANGSLSPGSVEATLYPRQTRKTQLTVTVDD
jgi:hypothetical protein